MQDTDEDYQSDDEQSINTGNGTESTKIDDDEDDDDDDGIDDNRIITRQSPRKKAQLSQTNSNPSPSTRRHSIRKVVKQTKSRITSMCRFILNSSK
jgi:hypothetical protein